MVKLVPVDGKRLLLLLRYALTNRLSSEFLPCKLRVVSSECCLTCLTPCSFFMIVLRCFKELEPWRIPNTSRPIKKVGVRLVQWIGGGGRLFLHSFFNCMQMNLCFSVSSVPVSRLNHPGRNFESRSHGDKRQNWCIIQFCDAQNDPNCCFFEDQRTKCWDFSSDLVKVLVMG